MSRGWWQFQGADRVFGKEAIKFANKIPGVDSTAMGEAMMASALKYAVDLEAHSEGSHRNILKAVVAVADAAESLELALGKLGPKGRAMVLGQDVTLYSFLMKTEPGQWLMKLDQLKEQHQPELDDTPWAGRPEGTTNAQQQARRALLLNCYRFLEPLSAQHIIKVFNLVPEMARAVHRVVCDPDLPDDSQLFRKEWKALRTVQK